MILRDRLPAIIVNPTTPIGPRDIKPTPTGRILLDAARGRIPAFVDTGLNFAHVDDIAEGHLLAFEHGRIGERYILGGENVLAAGMLADDRRASRPARAAHQACRAGRCFRWRWRRGGRPAHGQGAVADGRCPAHVAHRMFFTSAKAERELGYRAAPIRKAWSMRWPGSARPVI